MKKLLIAALLVATACSAQSQRGAARRADAIASSVPSQLGDAYDVTAVGAKLIAIDVNSPGTVHVSAHRGVVTLSGAARTASEKNQYVQAARSISGVKAVVDRLRVDSSLRGAPKTLSDAALAAKVKSALIAQTGVNALHVSVRSRAGMVTLAGTAPTPAMHEAIVQTVRSVSGVVGVVDRVTVRP